MPFLKLDCGILDSSLWPDKPARDIFLTALLMACPKDFEAPVAQIKADCLEPTGWSAPAGWYGFVAAAGSGIVRRAMVDDVEGIKALVRLGEPDLDSRSDAYQGRRMVRVDGGYLILNFIDYRERDYTVAERQRRWRERKKATVTPLRNVTGRYITEAEADVQCVCVQESSPLVPLGGTGGNGDFALKLKPLVGKLYHKKETDPWSYAELHALAEVARRPDVMEEFRQIEAFKRGLGQKDARFFPQSAGRLLQDWTATLDRARTQKPTTNNSDSRQRAEKITANRL